MKTFTLCLLTLFSALLLTPLAAIHAAAAPKLPATPGGASTTTPVPHATVTERRLPNGDSELHLLDAQGKILETAVVILNGELTMPPATGHQATRNVGGTNYYLPFEYEPCSQWHPNQKGPGNRTDVWFTYGAGKGFEPSQPYPAVKLAAEITEARRRGASNILLSCAPDHTGKFREGDGRQLTELGRLLDIENTHNNRQ